MSEVIKNGLADIYKSLHYSKDSVNAYSETHLAYNADFISIKADKWKGFG